MIDRSPLCLLLLCGTTFCHAETPISERAAELLDTHCIKCHGEQKRSGQLSLADLTVPLTGSSGLAIVPGNPADSRLITLVLPDAEPHMPPGDKQLSAEQIELLRDWIGEMPRQTQTEPAGATDLPPLGTDPTAVINYYIATGYAKAHLEPSARCDDETFLRRLYLDLEGRLPTVEEAQSFLQDSDSTKRVRLIDQLLQTEMHAQHMAEAMDVMLMGRDESKRSQRRQHGWLNYLRDVFANNRPWDQVAHEILLGRADSKQRGHLWFLYERADNHQDIAEAIAKGFFGIDIQCAQCHDHPLASEIHQSHYWGLVSFYKRSKNAKSQRGIALAESAIGGFDEYANALTGTTEASMLTFYKASTVSENRPAEPSEQEDKDELYTPVEGEPRVPQFSRREKFVREVLHEHPLVARSMVNRIWALLIGRGIVHPATEMDSTHAPSHPELLQWLANDFAAHGYDLRRLIRTIVNSNVYQLASESGQGAVDPQWFTSGQLKPLTAEALQRCMATALDVPVESLESVGPSMRALFPDVLNKATPTSLKQSLMLTNHPGLNRSILNAAQSLLNAQASETDLVNELYFRAFTRSPDESERERVLAYLENHSADPSDALAGVIWAVVTSAEFHFNH